jgi:aryl-alcohol dehydrogenase-like predicted oxidoreductase
MAFADRITLGRTGLTVSRIGLATGGGALPAAEVERAFERGINYFYWGTLRAKKFGEGLRNVARTHRSEIVVVVQTYTRVGSLMAGSLERALRRLGLDHTDLLLLGWWNRLPPPRILDAALALRERGLTRHVMISCHDRTTFKKFIDDPAFGAIMVRYNAAHPGAEQDVFPQLDGELPRPGVVAYTVTRWGTLLDRNYVPEGEPLPRASDCYRFALSNPNVGVCLTAPENGEQLDESLATLERGPLRDDESAWLRRVGVAVKAATAGQRRTSPIDIIDRIGARFGGGDSSAL